MSQTIPFKCPHCGGETVKTSSKPDTASDLKGAICTGCGYEFSEDDIRTQAKKIIDKMIRNAFKKH